MSRNVHPLFLLSLLSLAPLLLLLLLLRPFVLVLPGLLARCLLFLLPLAHKVKEAHPRPIVRQKLLLEFDRPSRWRHRVVSVPH